MASVSLTDCKSVLRKLGIDPNSRIDRFDQDWEYTSCRSEELGNYLALYSQPSTTPGEQRILCCFLLQCLNGQIKSGRKHPLQKVILQQLFDDQTLHQEELDYWMDTSNSNKDNWWPITETLLQFGGPTKGKHQATDDR